MKIGGSSRSGFVLVAWAALLVASPAAGQTFNAPLTSEFHSPISTPGTAYFGSAAAIDGSKAVISLHGELGVASTYPGDAFIYNTSTWQQQVRLDPTDPTTGDWFGESADLRNGVALVTAPGKDVAGLWHAGSAYLFNATSGQQIAKLATPTPVYCGWFGWTGALGGSNAYVGVCRGPWGSSNPGRVEVFSTSTGAYQTALQGDAPSTWYGMSVAANNQVVAVGDWGTGAVYVYDAGTNQRVAKLSVTGTVPGFFGTSVAVSGNQVLVGTTENGPAGQYEGSAYLFDWTTQQMLRKFVPQDGKGQDYFGSSVALVGNMAVVGAYSPYDTAGSVYIYDTASGTQLQKLLAPDGRKGDMFGYWVSADANLLLVHSIHGGTLANPSGMEYAYTTPEPATLALLALGGLAILARRRRAKVA